MAGITTGLAKSLAQKLSDLRKALPILEEVIPPGAQAQGRKIDKEITKSRRLFLSESNTHDLVDWLEIGVSELGDGATDDECLQFEDLTVEPLDPYVATIDATDALHSFYDTLRTCWPVQCEYSHQAMLRLVADRRDMSQERGSAEIFEFDTLSLTHSRYWGRVRFLAK